MTESTVLLLLLGLCSFVLLLVIWLFLPADWRNQQRRGIKKTIKNIPLVPHLQQDAAAPTGQSEDLVRKSKWFVQMLGDELVFSTRNVLGSLGSSWYYFLATILVTVGIASVVVLSGSKRNLQAYGNESDIADEKILAELRNHDLVPPAPLPESMFSTPEVEAARPMIRYADRKWGKGKLDADFEQRLLMLYKMMAERGYQMTMLEGYRSPERQNQLLAKSGTVTKAGAYKSYHQFGMAADSAFLRDGKIVISEKDSWAMQGYKLLGEEAAKLGFVWGGNWSFRDYGHVELHRADIVLGQPPPEHSLE